MSVTSFAFSVCILLCAITLQTGTAQFLSQTGLKIEHPDGRVWRVDENDFIRLNSGTPLNLTVYKGAEVYGSARGSIAFFHNNNRSLSVRHFKDNLKTTPFNAKENPQFDYAWNIFEINDGLINFWIHNDYDVILNRIAASGSVVGYDSRDDQVLIVSRTDTRAISWRIYPWDCPPEYYNANEASQPQLPPFNCNCDDDYYRNKASCLPKRTTTTRSTVTATTTVGPSSRTTSRSTTSLRVVSTISTTRTTSQPTTKTLTTTVSTTRPTSRSTTTASTTSMTTPFSSTSRTQTTSHRASSRTTIFTTKLSSSSASKPVTTHTMTHVSNISVMATTSDNAASIRSTTTTFVSMNSDAESVAAFTQLIQPSTDGSENSDNNGSDNNAVVLGVILAGCGILVSVAAISAVIFVRRRKKLRTISMRRQEQIDKYRSGQLDSSSRLPLPHVYGSAVQIIPSSLKLGPAPLKSFRSLPQIGPSSSVSKSGSPYLQTIQLSKSNTRHYSTITKTSMSTLPVTRTYNYSGLELPTATAYRASTTDIGDRFETKTRATRPVYPTAMTINDSTEQQ